MQKTIKPEILLFTGLICIKLIPLIIGHNTLAGFIGFASFLVLFVGAAGIAQRNRVSLVIFLLGFSAMLLSLVFVKVLDSTDTQWLSIGRTGSLLIFFALLISWGVSFVKFLSKKG